MELDKIELLLEKYFRSETNLSEERALQNYFATSNIAPNLEKYKPMFMYYGQSKNEKFNNQISLPPKKMKFAWMSIAAAAVVLIGIGTYFYTNNNIDNQKLGTYDNPDEAFKATQEALALLSNHVNTGVESIQYINEYQTTKDKIFISN